MAGPRLLADAASLEERAHIVAAAIEADHPDGLVLVGVLKSSLIFLADLVRHLTVPTRIEMVSVAPYDGVAGRARLLKDVDRSVAGEGVVLVAGTVDTGLTADFLVRHLSAAGPQSVRLATMADRPTRRLIPITANYVAIEAPDEVLVGFGLGIEGRFRNLPDLWSVDPDTLRAGLDVRSFPAPEPGARRSGQWSG